MSSEAPGTILVLGASGFLGSNIALSAVRTHRVIAHSSTRPVRHPDVVPVVFDVLGTDSIEDLVASHDVDLVVNCVALTSLEECESHPERATSINAAFPGDLARRCRGVGVPPRLVHVSTDAVFGATTGPHSDASTPSPIGAYGRSKFTGEAEVLSADPSALVMRTNVVGWSPTRKKSLLEYFHDNLVLGRSVPGFTDVMFRPVSAQAFWRMCTAWLAETEVTGRGGIRHATGRDRLSKHDFGRLVATCFELDPELVVASSIADSHLTAPRSNDLDVLPSVVPDPGHRITRLAEDLRELRSLGEAGWREELGLFAPQEEGTAT